VARLSAESYRRNRDLQRKRNVRSNANRSRTYGNLDSHIRDKEARPFIGWDGEGYRAFSVGPDGETTIEHRYMLFGSSTQQYVAGIDLGTRECLDLILFVESENPSALHVGFAFEYDVNMILKDLEWRHLAVLHDAGAVKWNGYRIKHTPHKSLSISKNGISATIFDVFGFFHTSYLTALSKHSIGTREQISVIKSGKSGRSQFTYSQLSTVIQYWSVEISLLPPLMESLREACYSAGFYITQWHGPGALASYALRKYGVLTWKGGKVPPLLSGAVRLAYAGGRFQAWKCGYYEGNVYTADINSAYAYACSVLPRLDRGEWKHAHSPQISGPSDIQHFALYRIRFDARELERSARSSHIPFPLFNRDKKGRLTWPAHTEGWYWSPEAALVAGNKYAVFTECWIFSDNGERPFDFVRGAYARRLELQSAGNPVEKAYKWFLASIYGQFAQRVGWDKANRRAPKSHQLEWAGYITSYCRAYVFRAAMDVAKRGGLISIDTDGVTSTVPFNNDKLPGGVGTGLGEWKLESFTGLLFWQNGIYWLRNKAGKWKDPKTRGIPRGSISFDNAQEALGSDKPRSKERGNPTISLHRNRFIGYRQALHNQFKIWRHWQEEPVEIEFGGSGKGRHVASMCALCTANRINSDERIPGADIANGGLHDVVHFPPADPLSRPHKLPWLDEIRREEQFITDKGIWDDETY
jgi:hypothetical protein